MQGIEANQHYDSCPMMGRRAPAARTPGGRFGKCHEAGHRSRQHAPACYHLPQESFSKTTPYFRYHLRTTCSCWLGSHARRMGFTAECTHSQLPMGSSSPCYTLDELEGKQGWAKYGRTSHGTSWVEGEGGGGDS